MRNPRIVGELIHYFSNDLLAQLGRYSYRQRILFIAGLPKSGTTWLETQLAKIPGYNLRFVRDPDGCTTNHDVCEDVFRSLPAGGFSILKLHTRYTPQNFEVITKFVPKFLVVIRDLRDMCVSRYFHVKNDIRHRHHNIYATCSLEDGMSHCIKVVLDEYVPWVEGWMRIARERLDTILVVKYEDMNKDPAETVAGIGKFFDIPISRGMARDFARSKLVGQRDLALELSRSVGLGTKSTARRGKMGEWKQYFNKGQKRQFSREAGWLLESLGYEAD